MFSDLLSSEKALRFKLFTPFQNSTTKWKLCLLPVGTWGTQHIWIFTISQHLKRKFIKIKLRIFICISVEGGVTPICHQRITCKSWFSFFYYVFQELNSGGQAWRQVRIISRVIHCPEIITLLRSNYRLFENSESNKQNICLTYYLLRSVC